jgi:hypothetical protein
MRRSIQAAGHFQVHFSADVITLAQCNALVDGFDGAPRRLCRSRFAACAEPVPVRGHVDGNADGPPDLDELPEMKVFVLARAIVRMCTHFNNERHPRNIKDVPCLVPAPESRVIRLPRCASTAIASHKYYTTRHALQL